MILLLAAVGPAWMVLRPDAAPARTQQRPTYAPFPITNRDPALPIPSEPLSLEGAVRRGRSDAPVVVIEYSNFECPTCRQFHGTVFPTLRKEFVDPGTAQWVFRHFPVESQPSHQNSAGTAAECAGNQGAFWRYHDRLFASPLATAHHSEWAAELGLDRARFDACMKTGAAARIDADARQGKSIGLRSAPSWVFGVLRPDGKSITVVRIYTSLKALEGYRRGIQEALAKAQGHPWAPER
jgi:protein-disulfide isomerase